MCPQDGESFFFFLEYTKKWSNSKGSEVILEDKATCSCSWWTEHRIIRAEITGDWAPWTVCINSSWVWISCYFFQGMMVDDWSLKNFKNVMLGSQFSSLVEPHGRDAGAHVQVWVMALCCLSPPHSRSPLPYLLFISDLSYKNKNGRNQSILFYIYIFLKSPLYIFPWAVISGTGPLRFCSGPTLTALPSTSGQWAASWQSCTPWHLCSQVTARWTRS